MQLATGFFFRGRLREGKDVCYAGQMAHRNDQQKTSHLDCLSGDTGPSTRRFWKGKTVELPIDGKASRQGSQTPPAIEVPPGMDSEHPIVIWQQSTTRISGLCEKGEKICLELQAMLVTISVTIHATPKTSLRPLRVSHFIRPELPLAKAS